MKILYIHQYFRTPDEGGPLRSYYLAKGLVEKGFEVEMITSYTGKKKLIKNIEGINVHYLPISYYNGMNFKRRVISFLKFMYLSVDEASTIKNVDLCYATSTPLTVGMAAIKIKERFDIPYIFEVRDGRKLLFRWEQFEIHGYYVIRRIWNNAFMTMRTRLLLFHLVCMKVLLPKFKTRSFR